MIRYALRCGGGHEFDAWFSSSGSYEEQCEAGVIRCPVCGKPDVEKAPMAPAVLRGARAAARYEDIQGDGCDETLAGPNTAPDPAYAALRDLREDLTANAADVGTKFAEEARKMHYGEAEKRSIHGKATVDEAKSLYEEGIPVIPLPKLPNDHN